MRYAEILLPLPFTETFTYKIPDAIASNIGVYYRVLVPFGNKRIYTGIVTEIHEGTTTGYETKEILSVLDENPVVKASQLELWKWISFYYACPLGDVYKAAFPSALRIESDSLDSIDNSINQGYKPKTETTINLAGLISNEEKLGEVFDSLQKAKKQLKLFYNFLELTGIIDFQKDIDFDSLLKKSISKKKLLEDSGASATVLKALVEKGVLCEEEKTVSRLEIHQGDKLYIHKLSDKQQNTCFEITKAFEKKNVVLLSAPHSESKIQVLIKIISGLLEGNRQVLYLLPEISVTKKVTDKLSAAFGEKFLVYHSDYSENERVEVWNKLLHSGESFLVLGTRSSVFLPFSNLGLVIIDEEHESSYKQQDPSPRYHARNVAMILAQQHHAKTLLSSATPSLESFFWAFQEKYGIVSLNKEGDYKLPDIEIVDVKDLRKKRRMVNTLLSPNLKESISKALINKEQVILFQNRRGFAPVVTCEKCGETPRCQACDVTLTYHRITNRLVCHYCDYSIPMISKCPACGSEDIKLQGVGTEKLEEEMNALFPDATISRLDLDTAKNKKSCNEIISDFESGKTHILIGTQMVSRMLEVENVSLVGVIGADAMMNVSDFRANERAMQLMTQIAYHSIKKSKTVKYIIQTSQRENVMFDMIKNLDYDSIAKSQLTERFTFQYPPYTRLILIVLRSKEEKILDEIVSEYSEKLRKQLGNCVSEPLYPAVARVQNLHVRHIMIKSELSFSVSETRSVLVKVHNEMKENKKFRKTTMYYNVDTQ
jgi:primosomal protein N' (replication factor Y)